MSALWIEPFGGLAGDMFLAALLDLGDPRFSESDLLDLADALVPGEAEVAVREVLRGGLRALHLCVRTPESEHAPQRHLSELEALVERAPLSQRSRTRAMAVFRCIAAAEAHVHGVGIEEIHFHEIGAVDSVVDVAGAVLALERLNVERVFASPPLLGSGHVHCAHGELPVPTPGTAEIVRGLPLRGGGDGERLTPTGAALLRVLVDEWAAPRAFEPSAIGYGAGTREGRSGPANLARVQLGRIAPVVAVERTPVWLGEFNLDDASGQAIGYALAKLRAAGALDVWTTACQMKKERPGTVVSFLARPEDRDSLEYAAFAHTPTFGVRWSAWERRECRREMRTVQIDGWEVRVKVRRRPGVDESGELEPRDLAPEYEDVAAWARATDADFAFLRERAVRAALELES